MVEKIKLHFEDKKYCKVKRKVGDDTYETNDGFIVAYSDTFVVLKEVDDFVVRGNLVFQIASIAEIRRNKSDIFFEKIYKREGITETIKKDCKIDLTSWQTIFKSIKELGFNVIVKNENPDEDTFDIGPITKVTKSSLYIQYFDATGLLDSESTKINWEQITVVNFDDIYINVLSKYLKEQIKT